MYTASLSFDASGNLSGAYIQQFTPPLYGPAVSGHVISQYTPTNLSGNSLSSPQIYVRYLLVSGQKVQVTWQRAGSTYSFYSVTYA